MGNQNSQEISQEKVNRFEESFEFYSRLSDPRSEVLEIYTSKFSQELLSKYTRVFGQENKIEHLVSSLTKRIQFDHPNILKIHGYKKQSKNDFCGGSTSCTIFEEFHFQNFNEEIQKRILEKVKLALK